MNFGLTGIGIGGLFYIGCAIIILSREGYRKIRLRYHEHPRQLLFDLIFILIGMIVATFLTDRGLEMVIRSVETQFGQSGSVSVIPSTGLASGQSLLISVGVLAVVLAVTYLLRFFISAQTRKEIGRL